LKFGTAIIIVPEGFNMTWKSIQQTQVTHDTFECIWLGNYFGYILSDLMNQHAVDKVRKKEYFTSYDILHYHFKNLFDDTYEAFGGGYVKDSVYIALESVLDSENFIDAIIKTIDYGQDTDTNACITGMLAGAYYGFDSIPKKLIEEIKDLELIEDIYNKLIDLRNEINAE
jgi:ADP-ribosylglycohydrolase